MLLLLLASLCVSSLNATYYKYEFPDLPSESIYEMTWDELNHWEKTAELALNERGPTANCLRMLAYMRMAQNDFAELGKGKGSVSYLSYNIVKLFKPDFTVSKWEKGMDDPFSRKLGDLVFEKYEKRFKDENIEPQVIQGGAGWNGTKPFFGVDTSSLTPWHINKEDFICLEPPSNDTFWSLQMDQVDLFSSKITDKEKNEVDFWASSEGDLLKIADYYMYEINTPLLDRAKIRAILASAHSDACSSCFFSKYKYMVKRPFMFQEGFKPVIETPNHPSYPSAHSTNSAALVVLLDHYLPNPKWRRYANEAGLSRIIGGIHYPIDHLNGQELGSRIGNAILDHIKTRSNP